MEKRNYIITALLFPFVLFTLLSFSSCKGKKTENDKMAALYDESLSKTYHFVSGIHQSLYVVINTFERAAFEAKDDYSSDFKESVENHFYNFLESDRAAKEAWTAVVGDESFRSTAVCRFLCHDGGPEREEQTLAFRKFEAVWFELSSPSRLEYDSYDNLVERLNILRKTLSESMPIIVKHMKSYDKKKYGWREYTPYK